MSLLLNQGIAGFECGAIAYGLVSFVLFACHRSCVTTPVSFPTPITTTPVASVPVTATVAEAVLNTPRRPAPPSARKVKPTERLRQQCKDVGIQWRNAHGKGKHLTTAAMKQRLEMPALST